MPKSKKPNGYPKKNSQTPAPILDNPGQKRVLAPEQKQKLTAKRKYTFDRIDRAIELALGFSHKGTYGGEKNRAEKIKLHTDNAHLTGFEKAVGPYSQTVYRNVFRKDHWHENLCRQEREEWLINCYRMRNDDDNRWGGGYMHGIMEVTCNPSGGYGLDIKGPNMKKNTIVKDFLKFMLLAHEKKVYPTCPNKFSVEKMLEIAPKYLEFCFTKECAKAKYGEENVYSLKIPSLRRTAEYIYRTAIVQEHNVGKEKRMKYIIEELDDQIEESIDDVNFENSHYKIFEIWRLINTPIRTL